MEPQLDKSPVPGLALPQPQVEQAGPVSYVPEQGLPNPESYAAPAAQQYAAAQAPVADGTMPLPVIHVPGAAPPVAPAAASPVQTDDADELDRELINKAKAIVERTKNDPYLESHELGKAKAEYLRVRYNKHIKVVEEQAK